MTCEGCGLKIINGVPTVIYDEDRGLACDPSTNELYAKVDGISIKYDANGNLTNAFNGAVTGSGTFSDIPNAVLGFDYDRTLLINNPYARQVCGIAVLSYSLRIGNDITPAQYLDNFSGVAELYGGMYVNGAVQTDVSSTVFGGLLQQASGIGVLLNNGLRFLDGETQVLHKSLCVPANASLYPITLRIKPLWLGGAAPQFNIQNIQLSFVSLP